MVAKPGFRAAGGPGEAGGKWVRGRTRASCRLSGFHAQLQILISRAGVSTSTEGVGGRTAVSLGGLCAVLEHNCLVRIAKLVGVGTERPVP